MVATWEHLGSPGAEREGFLLKLLEGLSIQHYHEASNPNPDPNSNWGGGESHLPCIIFATLRPQNTLVSNILIINY